MAPNTGYRYCAGRHAKVSVRSVLRMILYEACIGLGKKMYKHLISKDKPRKPEEEGRLCCSV